MKRRAVLAHIQSGNGSLCGQPFVWCPKNRFWRGFHRYDVFECLFCNEIMGLSLEAGDLS